MLNTLQELRETSEACRAMTREGRELEFYSGLNECFQAGEIDTDRISLRSLYEHFVEEGENRLREMDHHHRAHGTGVMLQEAGGDAISTSAFSAIIGQISYSRVLDQFNQPGLIGRSLFPTTPADTQAVEMIPGIAPIGDVADDVGEGEPYPRVGLGPKYVTVPEKIKDGFIIEITEEAVREDKTGQLVRMMDSAAQSMALTDEKERINCAIGVDSTYSRNGDIRRATYSNAIAGSGHNFDNLLNSSTLLDFTDIERNFQQFATFDDPDSGEPIFMSGTLTLLVPYELWFTALRAVNPTLVQRGDTQSATDFVVRSNNPLNMQKQYSVQVKHSQYVGRQSSADGGETDTWWFGDFGKAFEYREIFPIQTFRMGKNSMLNWERDIIAGIKVRRKGVCAVIEPRYVIENLVAA